MRLKDNAYSADDVAAALRDVGVKSGDIVFSHIGLGPLGLPKDCETSAEGCGLVHDGLRRAVGSSGTIVIPTFSYSFTKGEDFDPATSPSTIGPFSEYFRLLPRAVRSVDPLFSVAAEGPLAVELTRDIPHSSFSSGCVYDRLTARDAVVANLGLTLDWLTYIHSIEEEWGVPYRYLKRFEGRLRIGTEWQNAAWDYFVRVDVDATCPSLGNFRTRAVNNKILRTASLGLGSVEAMRCRDIKALASSMLDEDAWSLVHGPAFEITAEMKT